MNVLPLLLITMMRAPAYDSLCTARTTHADPSLYCLPLLSTDLAPSASGIAILRLASSPFGLAVTRDGRPRYRVELTLSGLPQPASLGPYRSFVAWATTPELDPVIPLGQVGNGRYVLTEIALERFIVMVSAERSAGVSARAGPLVLRGTSPSLLMVPHGVTALPPQSGSDHVHGSQGWTMPPMHPRVSRMPFGLERLRPPVQPFLPAIPQAALRKPIATSTYQLEDGDSITLTAGKVVRRLRDKSFVMYAYDGQIPGPRLELTEGATVTVRFRNQTDLPSSIHWHGIRLENRDDGVPGLTQPPIPPGGEFVYRVHAPDPGIFWYHPHSRGDVAQDLGLAGNIVVRGQADRVPAKRVVSVGREAYLMLDDLLMGEDGLFPYGRQAATHALMGRFGNVLLVNGDEAWRMDARPGEQVRLNLTNAASARTFNLSLDGAELRVVASDAGLFAEPRVVESAVIAPSERYVVEARFGRAGTYALVNRVRAIDRVTGRFFAEIDTLGLVRVGGRPVQVGRPALVRNDDSAATLLRRVQSKAPDRIIILTLKTGTLPFGLVQALRLDTAYVQPVEWTSAMPMMDWLSTAREVRWILRDSLSGAEGMALDWRVSRGRPLVVRLVNDKNVLHPMGHPIHLHGQRFLVLAQNGTPNADPAWKDTVMVPAGGIVDLLVDTSNPGRWMLHCHIAEHLEAGMHTVLTVE